MDVFIDYMTQYKPSRYNHFYPVDDTETQIGGLSLLTNATLLFEKDDWIRISDLLTDNVERPDQPEEQALFDILVDNKFLIPADFDELNYLKEVFEVSKGSDYVFSLGIITSLQCNFRCPYCYQDHKDSRMSVEVQQSILKYLEKALPGKVAYHVAWWGGEPLLEAAMISSFGEQMMALCDRLGVRYTSSIISNCYLLTNENIEILRQARLNHLQVTLDGPKEFHNKRRFLIGGGGTYDIILDGLSRLVSIIPDIGITVRVNVSKGITEIAPWQNLLNDLEPLKSRIALHFTPVAPALNFDKLCMNIEMFDEFYRQVVTLSQERGFLITAGRKTPGTAFCGAIPTGNWLIHPRGFVTKCTARMDSEEGSLGRLLTDGTFELNDEAPKWLGFTPFDIEECANCEVMPACMGGCLKIPMHGDAILDRCVIKTGIRYLLRDRVLRAKRRLSRSSSPSIESVRK